MEDDHEATASPLSFDITFHSWFRVGADVGRDGLDIAVNRDNPLPARHLKGLMRAEAVGLVGQRTTDEVFGTTGDHGRWAWTDADPLNGATWEFHRSNRVEIDPQVHAAVGDHLVFAEDVGLTGCARFCIDQMARMDQATLQRDTLVLRAASLAVHAVGGWRNRGMGWVSVTPADGSQWSLENTRELLELAHPEGNLQR